MTAILKVDTIQDVDGNNIINENSNTITVGAAGDTVDVPGTEVKTNKVSPTSGTSLQIGDSGDTVNIVGTLQNNGSALVTGKILQVVTQQINGYVSVSSQSEVTTGITKAITPTASNSKILIFITGTFSMNVSRATTFCGVGLKRTVGGTETNLQGGGNNDNIANNVFGASNMQMQGTYAYSKEDSPNTTSEVTYTLKARIETSGEAILFNNGGMGSFITLMEIGA
jgi:hypothetical protein